MSLGARLLCRTGFIMGSFINTRVFEDQGLAYPSNIKLGLLVSAIAAIIIA